MGSSWTRDRTHVSCIGRWILYHWATREAPQTGCMSGNTRLPLEAGLCPSHLHLPRAWHVIQSQLMLVSVSFSASISVNDINCPRARWGAWLLVGNWTLFSLHKLSMTVWAEAAFEDGQLPLRGRPQAPLQGSDPSWIPRPPVLGTTCHIKSIGHQERAQRIRMVTRMREGGSGGKLSSAICRRL